MKAAIVQRKVSAAFTVTAANRAAALRQARVIARNLLGEGYAATLDLHASPSLTADTGVIVAWEFDVYLTAESGPADE